MSSLIAYFAHRPFLARIITVMVLMTGLATLFTLKLQEYPNVAFETVQINTSYPGATAQDIELNVTNPIEKELRSVQGINYFFSESSDGMSYIELEVLPGEDTAGVVRDIQQAVDRVKGLPKDIENPPTVTQEKTSSFEVLTFGVSLAEQNLSPESLQAYAYQLEKKVTRIAGVSSATLSGYNEREFWVELDPTKSSRYQITFQQISNAINQRNLSQSGGIVESWASEQKIVTMAQVQSAQEIGNIVIKALPNGTIVRISDVAEVKDRFARSTKIGYLNGKQAVLFSITNNGNADIITTVDSIKNLIADEQNRLSEQFEFQLGMNLASDMSEKFSIVSTNGTIGLILVLVVLSLIMKRQVAFWVSLSIPFCVLGVMLILPIFGLNLDSVTLAAMLLVIGIIVDDSVIVAESIYQQKELGKTGVEAAVAGTLNVIKPLLASLITTTLVFIPMFFIPGTMGKVIVVIPLTVIAALLFSLMECTLTLPAHLATSLKKEQSNSDKKDRFDTLSQYYRSILTRCIQYRKIVIASALVVAILSCGLITTLKLDIFPSESAKYVEVYTEVQPGTPLDQVRQQHVAIEQAIEALPLNERVSYEMSYSSPVSTGVLVLTNYDQRVRTADEIIAELNQNLADKEGPTFVKFSVDAGGPPPGEPVEIRVLGGNSGERDQAVTLVSDWLKKHPGITGVTNSEALKDPQLNIVPQYQWLAKYDLTVSDLAATLRIAFEGDAITSTWLGDQEVDIRLILDKKYRALETLKTTKIYAPDGRQVPLSRLARIEQIESPRLIKHYDGEREITVTGQISDDNISPVDLSTQLLSELAGQYSSNIDIDVGGEAENTNETMSGFMVAFPAAIVAIYFVLAIMFNSLLQPVLVMAVIPFSVIAALMALVVHFQALSLFALIGVLGMTGVVVNNSLVMINRINELREQGREPMQAVVDAAVSRFRPIILTSVTTVVGLLPLAYGLGGTDVYMGPMSLTLGYGLLFSLPVVLFVIPSLYALFFARKG